MLDRQFMPDFEGRFTTRSRVASAIRAPAIRLSNSNMLDCETPAIRAARARV